MILRRRIGSLWKVELEEEFEGSNIILGLEAEPVNHAKLLPYSIGFNIRPLCDVGHELR
ncbi:hypothetical protein [Paenibacillus sp. Soil724D2]|uniref:hypothetical protein n=1 Tax=Paenibacillus sp. (strain Soil724D2) TaxID=1736392 RepID=UPI000A8090EE|nr:hypothetical protein [Paenibacillus sp. Soil724D2]